MIYFIKETPGNQIFDKVCCLMNTVPEGKDLNLTS